MPQSYPEAWLLSGSYTESTENILKDLLKYMFESFLFAIILFLKTESSFSDP